MKLTETILLIGVSAFFTGVGVVLGLVLPYWYPKPIRKSSRAYLKYRAKKLCEVYPDEKAIALHIPYKEEICWIGSTYEDTLTGAGAVKVKLMSEPFVLYADTDVMRIFQVQALQDRQARGHIRRDDNVIRLQSYSNNSRGTVLQIQRARYSDQVQSNLVMDWTSRPAWLGGHALKKWHFKTLRTYLSVLNHGKLGPLDEPMMANTIGISVVLYYQNCAGEYLPYLPRRAKRQAVFDGGFHCTASAAAEWPKTGTTFKDIFVEDMYAELWEEVGIARDDIEVRNDIKVMVPLALCREFLRGGKPQIFFAGVTRLSKPELAEKRKSALQSQKKSGMAEITDSQLICSDMDDLRKEPLTLEARANLHYAETFVEQYRQHVRDTSGKIY